MIGPDCSQKFSEEFTVPASEIAELAKAEAFVKAGNFNSAFEVYMKALQKNPDSVPMLVNLGILYNIYSQPKDAEVQFKRAVELAPNNPLVRFFNSLFLLGMGELKAGWQEHHWRKVLKVSPTHEHLFQCKAWAGEELEKDTHVVVYTEQGKGDEIMTLTMLPDLLKRTSNVSVVCSPEMVPLFERSFRNVAKVYSRDAVKERPSTVFLPDYKAGVTELGQYLRSDFSDFPLSSTILHADTELTKALRKEWKGDDERPLVGIAWRSPNSLMPETKSTDLKKWGRILRNPNFRFVSLQYGDVHDEIAAAEAEFGVNIIEEGGVDFRVDTEKFATMVNAVDLVIAVSSTPVHFAGALGKPVWNITPEGVTRLWYWFSQRKDSPWYPSMKLFRNYAGEDILSRVANKLEDLGYKNQI